MTKQPPLITHTTNSITHLHADAHIYFIIRLNFFEYFLFLIKNICMPVKSFENFIYSAFVHSNFYISERFYILIFNYLTCYIFN